MTKNNYRLVGFAAALGIAASMAAVAVATPASASPAATPGFAQLCAQGDYTSEMSFHPGTTVRVDPGTCQTIEIPRSTGEVEVGGFFNDGSGHFTLSVVSDRRIIPTGVDITTTGTDTDAHAVFSQ
jgi:hypothetical protein